MMWSIESGRRAGRGTPKGWIRDRREQLCALACCAALAIAAVVGVLRSHAQSAPAPTNAAPEKVASAPAPAAGQQEKPPAANTSDEAQKKQIASECSDLLKLATDLKSEVDKTTRDTLSVTVVRKASAIEQLAHKVRTGSPKG
ncbi:MAG TPA: hypothetical protein VJX73_03110 [Terracidiphilus sp.]|nr:hypothetical protein [Terracidiphilus sp.]